jgi:hypothetical protein
MIATTAANVDELLFALAHRTQSNSDLASEREGCRDSHARNNQQ